MTAISRFPISFTSSARDVVDTLHLAALANADNLQLDVVFLDPSQPSLARDPAADLPDDQRSGRRTPGHGLSRHRPLR